MKISLPEYYVLDDIAEVKDGILYIRCLNSFEEIMRDLTYSLKGVKKCYFCGKSLNRKKATLDHLIPRDLGGITIPNNLSICCKECNGLKSNLLEEEFWVYMSLPIELKDSFLSGCENSRDFIKKNFCPCLPQKWITMVNPTEIMDLSPFTVDPKNRNLRRVKKFYDKYHKLHYPIIVDKDLKLLYDRYILFFANSINMSEAPTVILENVFLDY